MRIHDVVGVEGIFAQQGVRTRIIGATLAAALAFAATSAYAGCSGSTHTGSSGGGSSSASSGSGTHTGGSGGGTHTSGCPTSGGTASALSSVSFAHSAVTLGTSRIRRSHPERERSPARSATKQRFVIWPTERWRALG